MDKKKGGQVVTLRNSRIVPISEAVRLWDGSYVDKRCHIIEAYYAPRKRGVEQQSLCVSLYPMPHSIPKFAVKGSPGLLKWTNEEVYFWAGDERFVQVHDGGWELKIHTIYGYIGADRMGYMHEEENWLEINSQFFLNESVARENGMSYCRNCACWREGECDDCSNDDDGYRGNGHVAEYHSLERIDKRDDDWQFAVGIEIEKEDNNVIPSLHYQDIHLKWGWCIETDGSLDDDGFEAVSPIFNLFDNKTINKHLKEFTHIVDASYSSNCGGHIHVSSRNKKPITLYEELSPYYPLLFAMYPGRINRNYSQAMEKERMKDAGKYASVALHHRTVEFRIFPSPKSVTTLSWRLDLLRLMVTTPMKNYETLVDELLNIKSLLFKHLTLVYKTPERYILLIKRTIDFCKQFEEVDILRTKEVEALEEQLSKLVKPKQKKKIKEEEGEKK